MKVKITKWKPMTWYWLNREELEGKDLEVLEVAESTIYKGKISYLIRKPDKYVPARDCMVVSD